MSYQHGWPSCETFKDDKAWLKPLLFEKYGVAGEGAELLFENSFLLACEKSFDRTAVIQDTKRHFAMFVPLLTDR